MRKRAEWSAVAIAERVFRKGPAKEEETWHF